MEMTKTMTKYLYAALAAALIAPAAGAQSLYMGPDPVGTVSYALPRTVVSLQVEASLEEFYAGPYAKYARKYLGVDAKSEDSSVCRVTAVKMTPYSEADQSRRFSYAPGKDQSVFLALTSQGLVSFGGASEAETQWRFPAPAGGGVSEAGMSRNLTSESATLYKDVSGGADGYSTVAVQQKMVVEKSPETKASEAADMIFRLREKKIDMITGDTDATFAGEALSAAIREIDRLEGEYMALFLGRTESRSQTMTFEVEPAAKTGNQRLVAFRISDEDGLVSADNVSGRPCVLELVPDEVSAASQTADRGASVKSLYYRIPAVCSVRLSDGADVLLQGRIPVYQMGIEGSLPIINTK